MLFTNQCSCLANEAVVTIIQLHIGYREARNFAGSNFFAIFAFFSAIHKNKFTQIKITAKHFSAKIYSGVNILRLKFTTQKYSTKKSCLFNYNLSLSFRKKSGIQWNTDADRSIGPVLFENMHFYCTYSIKTKILSMLGTGYFLKIAKINSEQKTNLC